MGKLKLNFPKVKLDIFKEPVKIADFATKAILEAEQVLGRGPGMGKRKLNAVADALNDVIDIPYIPEGIEKVIFRMVAQVAYGFVKNKLDELRGEE